MADIFSVLSNETLEKIAAGGDLYKSMTDSELEAVAAIEAQQPPQQPVSPVSPIDPSTSSAMLLTIETIIASLGENNPPTEMGSDTIGGIDENPASDQFNPNVVGGAIGEVQTLVTPEEAKAMPKMGVGTKGALRVQEQGGPTAYDDDGSVVNWLGNLWNTIAYNSSGKVTAKSTNKHTQAILRGTVNKDGREVPLTQLDDDELDYLVDSAGWNGWKGWLGSFVGNRADDGIMQQWDRTTGATIQDPIARKAARVKHAQDIARGMIEQQESEKLAAGVELENRPKQFGADVGAGFIETASYMLPYLIPHTRGIMAGIVEAGDRTNELLNDVYYVDDNGTIRVKAQRDSTGAALAKGAARGAIAPLVEKFGGEIGAGMAGAIAKNTLGRIPLIKAASGKVVETTAGKAVSKWMNSMSRLGKYTGMQSMPVEMLEEFEDQVLDAGLGLNLREGEKRGTTALSRAAGAVKEFFKPENLRELAESMILIQVLGGGVAAMNDRRITKHLDSLIAKEVGITPEELSNYSLEDKQAAYQAFVEGLSEAEVAHRFNRGAEAINKLANTIRDGNYWKDNLDSFKEEALASMDEPAPIPDAESPKAYASEGDLLSAEEAQAQEQARAEWVPAEKSNEVAPGAVIELPDGTKLRRNIRGVVKWQLVGGAKNAIALADSAAEKLMADGFRVVTDASAKGKNNKGVITNETRTDEAPAQPEQAQGVTSPAGEAARPLEAGEAARPLEAGEAPSEVGGEVAATQPAVEAPTSASTETQVNPSPTTTENAERNFDVTDDAVDVLPTTDDDLPPSDDSESEILPSFENPEEKNSEEGLVEEELDVLPTTELPPDPKPTTTNRLKNAAGIDPTAVPTKKTKVDKLLTFPDSLEKYGEMTGRLLRTLDKGGVFPDSPKDKSIKAELARMDEAGWGEVYKAQMNWAGSPKDTRGEQPPRTPAEFAEWKKAKESAQTSENGSLNAPVETATTTPPEPTTSVEPLQQAPTKEDAKPNEPEDKSGEEVSVKEELDLLNSVNFNPTQESHVKDLIRPLSNVLKHSSKDYAEYDSKLREFVERFNEQFKKLGYLAEIPKLKAMFNTEEYTSDDNLGQRVEMVLEPALFKIYDSQKKLLRKGRVRTSSDAQSSYSGNSITAETGLLQELIANDAKNMALDAWLKKWNPVKERIRVNEDRYNYDREKPLAPLSYSALLGNVEKASILKKYGISDTHNVVEPESLPKPKLGSKKKTEAEKLEALTKRNIAKAKAVFDYLKANNPNATLDPYKFRYSQANTNGLKLDVLRNIVDIATVDDFIEQGLTNEQAEELFNAITVAYQEQSRRGSNSSEKASNDNKVSYAHGAMLAIDKLRNHPDDLKVLANAMKRVSDAFEFSRRRQDSAVGDMELAEADEDFIFWQSKHNELQAKFNALSESDQEKVVRIRSGIESKRDEADNQNEVSLNAGGDGGNIDIADSNAQTPGGEGGATTTMTGKGSVGTGGSLAGNRHIRIDKVDGDNLTATMVDAAGKKIGTKNMTRAQWEVFAKATLDDDIEIDPKNPQVGDMVRLSNQVNAESQEERDRRFAEDKNYQAWLKRQNANDADRMRERYEQESAKIAAGIGRNFIGGMKVKTVDREYIEGEDGNADERQSIIGTRGLHILGKDSAVKRAQKMIDEGASRLEVWQKTGVYRGKDGKYRYELPFGYNEASLVMQAVENIIANKNDGNAKGTATLGEAIDFLKQISAANPKEVKPSYVKNIEKLFEAYPWFSNITINTFATLRKGLDGQYNIKNKTIDIGEQAHYNFDEAGVFLHELQHAIQVAEGFLKGTSSVVSEDYHTRAGEVEARLAAYRATLTEKQRKSTPPWEYYSVAEKDQTLASWEQVEKSLNGDERVRYLRDPNTQKVVGTWNRKTNELTLFRGANASTLVHELGGHAAYQFAQEQAAQGDKTLLNKMNECINYALTNPKMKPLIEDIRSRYPEATDEVMRDEIFAALMERNSPIMQNLTKTLQGKAWYNRTWQAIKDAFRAMLTKMGFNKADLRGIDKMQPEEFMSWLDRTMADGKRLGALVGMELGDRGDSTRKMQVGEMGMSKSKHASSLLDIAKSFETQNASRRDIWEKTGWYRGVDNKWRYEIGKAALPAAFSKDDIVMMKDAVRLNGDAVFMLNDIPNYETLERLYPQLNNIIFAINDGMSENDYGSTLTFDNKLSNLGDVVIKLNSRLLDYPSQLRSTLVHELQHVIQDLESFSSGAGFDAEKYKRLAEDEKQFGQLFRANADLYGFDEWLKHIKSTREIDFLRRHNTIYSVAKRFIKENRQKINKEDLTFLQGVLRDWNNTRRELGEVANKYERTIGEVEARLTEARLKMSDKERRRIPPWEMYDTPVSRQIVRENGGRSDSFVGEIGASNAGIQHLEEAKDMESDGLKEKEPTSVRQLRSSTTTATSFMDDTRSRGEILEEKLVDSTAPIKSVQTEINNHARANGEEGVEEVVNADGSTDWRNSTDFVAAKDKENGHLERNIRELKTRYIDPAMEVLAKAIRPNQDKADLITDFNLYLQCKHAAARNRKIANDRGDTYTADYSEGMGMVTLPDGRRVGLSENVANQLLVTMERKYGAKFNNFDDAAQSVYKMLEADLYNRYQSGLLSAEDYIKYMERRTGVMDWGTYVPLKDDLQNTEAEAYKAVSFSPALKRNEFMKAKGRGENDIADSPFAAAVLQAEQGIRRSSRNVLANVEANLAAKMNGGFAKNGMTDFSVTELTSQGQPAYAEVVAGVDVRRTGTEFEFTFADGDRAIASAGASVVANRPDIHLFKRDGKLYAIRYPAGANGRGIAVANAFSGENMGNWGKGMSWVPRVTHWLSSMRTQYSPEFTVSNMLSDNLEALQALVGRYGLWDGGKAFGKALKYQWKNRKDLWHYVKTGEARGLVKNAIDAGILTKGGVVSQGIDAETKELTADLDKFIRKQKRISEMNASDMAKSFGRNVVDYISMVNSFAEYSTRIGIASALEEYGVPRKDAIKFARDATVNFNRKGTAMPYINGLYMFANAAVQGAMRSVQSFRDDFSDSRNPTSGGLGKNRKMKGELVGMLVVIGVAKAILDNALGDDDEREKEGGRNAQNLSEYDRKHNVGLPIGGGRQIVPLRFRGPYAAIPYLAQTFTRYAMGDIDAGDVGAILASELGSQTTELIGGNGVTNDKGEYDTSLFMQSIAPTLVDPFVQMGTGKDYKGDNRLRKKFDNTMPDSSNGKRNTPGLYKGIAQVLNYITGGNENRIGKFDAAPENVQLLVEFIGGAPLRDINNVVSSVKNATQYASGGTPEKPLSQIPFVRRFVREYPDVTGRYYDAIEMYERDKAEYKKTTRLEDRRELRKDKPYLSASNTNLDKLIERVKELTHLERGEVKRGRKWVEPKVERSEQQKENYRKQRLKLQATILRRLGE